MAKSHLDKTLTSLAGEFLVAGQLCLMGYMASLTLKNYPGVDIFCLNPMNDKQVAIQVKTFRDKRCHIPENIAEKFKPDQPFVFVQIRPDNSVVYFVLSASRIEHLTTQSRDDYVKNNPHVDKDKQIRILGVDAMLPFKGLEGIKRWLD